MKYKIKLATCALLTSGLAAMPAMADGHEAGEMSVGDCLMSAYTMEGGTFNNASAFMNWEEETLGTDSGSMTMSVPEPGTFEYLNDDGNVMGRWFVEGDGLKWETMGEDGSVTESMTIAVPVCYKTETGVHYFVEEWTEAGDPDADPDSLQAKSWDMRHEHWADGDMMITVIQGREAGTDNPYTSFSVGASQRAEAEAEEAASEEG